MDREIGHIEGDLDQVERMDASDQLEIDRFLEGEIERLRNDKFDIDKGWFWEPHVVPPRSLSGKHF
ncbi:MAG: hypothetical protein A2048_09265 [Deltaproteobacteria bacterium GWA2_45_12]|nr:MAG: hypothetical protein A2048_09265 [Deltaproteobacteria bacterium GWA2_45_12]